MTLKVCNHWSASKKLLKWRFAGRQIMANNKMLTWQLCDFPGDWDQYY